MSSRLRWLVALTVGGTLAATMLAAPTTPNGWIERTFFGDGVKAAVAMPGDTVASFGFIPFRLTVDNGQTRELRWRAAFHVSATGSSDGETTVAITVPPGRAIERWIYVPTPGAGQNSSGRYYVQTGMAAVTLTGTGIDETTLRFYAAGGRPNPMVPWAVSRTLETTARTRIAGLKATRGSRFASRSFPAGTTAPLIAGAPNLASFDPAEAAADWRAWSPFARVVILSDEFDGMAPAARAALRNWVSLGGQLYLAPSAPRAAARQPVGAGAVVTLARPLADEADDASGLFAPAGLFNGTAAYPSAGELSLQRGGLADKIPAAKGVGDWLIGFFVGFAVLIAPVNLYVLVPRRRRHWIFLTVPIISIVAVMVLVAMIYLQDGVGGEGVRRALVLLLPGDNQAAVFQEQVARTGMILNGGYPLADDVLCANVPAEDVNFQLGRTLRFDRNQGAASGDWFRSRARLAQHLRRLVPTRARVEQVGRASDGAPIVESTVAGTLRNFCLLDRDAVEWTADQIPQGTRVTLQRTAKHARDLATEFAATGSQHFRGLVGNMVEGFSPGRFVAFAGAADLAPIPTLATIRWKESDTMVTGMVLAADGGTP
jgi:hypothetical protein